LSVTSGILSTKQKSGVRLEILTFGEAAEYSRPAVARKPRIEIAGGLYHPITRGNNRKRIFQSHDDHLKFLRLLEHQKAKQPFYVYAYCLMPNHVHLLAKLRDDPISCVELGVRPDAISTIPYRGFILKRDQKRFEFSRVTHLIKPPSFY